MVLKLAYFQVLYVLLPILSLVFLYRLFWYKSPYYRFPLTQKLYEQKLTKNKSRKIIFFALRALTLLGLIFMIARPQWVDENSHVNVEGVDIILAIDVSGSMQCFDDPHDRRSRIDVAKEEAIRFIEKRSNDPIGIVIFGKDVLTCCPPTLDKIILKEITGKIELGMIDPDGTSLGTGLALAVNRLKNSKAKSKIIILLTDGEPTPHEKVDPAVAIDLAQQFGIKVYTIGIGNEEGGFVAHPFYGVQRVPVKLNLTLLKTIAEKTNGKFFRANNPKDMRTVYNTIDRLEKTELQTTVFHHYYEAFLTFIWFIVGLLGLELFLRLFIWRGI